MLGTAYNFAGCSCAAGIRKGKPACALCSEGLHVSLPWLEVVAAPIARAVGTEEVSAQ